MNIPKSLKSVYQPRKSRLKSCNGKCTLEIPSLEGYSYGHWGVCRYINGLMVFNNYTYSNTTTRHQWEIRSWLGSLGIKIDLAIECPKGLQAWDWANNAVKHEAYKIGELKAAMKRGQKAKNVERQAQIDILKGRINRIYWLTQNNPENKLSMSDINMTLEHRQKIAEEIFESNRTRKLNKTQENV